MAFALAESRTEVMTMLLTLDDVSYTAKPDRAEFGRLMNRLKSAQPREVDKHGLLEHIASGKTFVGGSFKYEGKDCKLISWQLAALDFDNETHVLDADGKPMKDENGDTIKRPLLPTEDGFISAFQALDRCESLGIAPLAVYQTLSNSAENPRFRIVFDMGEAIGDEELAKAVIQSLLGAFPEADQKCKNPNRLFLGTTQAVWAICEAWFL